jgi:hypothetical protein
MMSSHKQTRCPPRYLCLFVLACGALNHCTLAHEEEDKAKERLRGLLGKSGYVDKCDTGYAIQLNRNVDRILSELCQQKKDVISTIREVSIVDTAISDDGWRSLALFQSISRLDIQTGIKWSVGARESVAKLPRLRVLWAQRCGIDGKDLIAISRAEDLEILMLGHNPIKTGTFAPLGRLTKMYQLDLDKTGIADEDLGFVAKMPKLGHLSLKGTTISDASAEQLANCTKLRILVLVDTKVTAKGIRVIREKCPNAIITWGSGENQVLDDPVGANR